MKIANLLRNKITFEDGTLVPVNSDIILEYGIKEGIEFSEEEISKIMEEAAYSKAVSILSRQDKSEKGLQMKLRESFRDGALIEKTVRRVKEKGYLNDSDYAKSFLNGKNYSRKQAVYELMKKGVGKKEAESALEESEIDELSIIKKYISKMAGKDERKIIESLMRKGFEYEDIRNVLRGKS